MNKDLQSFIKYCKKHPEQRFWQALRNWSGYDFILGSTHYDPFMFDVKFLEKNKVEIDDTFYKEFFDNTENDPSYETHSACPTRMKKEGGKSMCFI